MICDSIELASLHPIGKGGGGRKGIYRLVFFVKALFNILHIWIRVMIVWLRFQYSMKASFILGIGVLYVLSAVRGPAGEHLAWLCGIVSGTRSPPWFRAVVTGFIHMAESECLNLDLTKLLLLEFLSTNILFWPGAAAALVVPFQNLRPCMINRFSAL
jgi:hypothetical protein